jgi:flagellar hook-basal body complex protein FliE
MDITSMKGVQFSSGMPSVAGADRLQKINMLVGHEKHMTPANSVQPSENVSGSFADALQKAIGSVEKLDTTSQKLTEQSIYDPDSVEAHTLILSAEKAKFALRLTKNLSDGVIRAYKEITNPK